MFPYALSDDSLSVFIDGNAYQTSRDNPHWTDIKTALADPGVTGETLINLIKPIHALAETVHGLADITVHDGALWYGSEEIHSSLAVRIVDIAREGLPLDGWLRFAQNVYANPFTHSREELYEFLAMGDSPITPDGCFLAYKHVRANYKDGHTGTLDNSVGQIVTMPGGRKAVDADRRNECSVGLHFCSKFYLGSYASSRDGHVMIVKVNPADVVAFPKDYNRSKGRCWRYEVVNELPANQVVADHVWSPHDDDLYDWVEQSAPPAGVAATEERVVMTKTHGAITKDRFEELKAESGGTTAGIARNLGLSPGTVQSWKTTLYKGA